MTDQELLAGVVDDLTRLRDPMTVHFRPITVLHFAGLVQLALRHPDLEDSALAAGAQFLDGVREYFASSPSVLELLRRGDDPRHDIARPR